MGVISFPTDGTAIVLFGEGKHVAATVNFDVLFLEFGGGCKFHLKYTSIPNHRATSKPTSLHLICTLIFLEMLTASASSDVPNGFSFN